MIKLVKQLFNYYQNSIYIVLHELYNNGKSCTIHATSNREFTGVITGINKKYVTQLVQLTDWSYSKEEYEDKNDYAVRTILLKHIVAVNYTIKADNYVNRVVYEKSKKIFEDR